MKVRKRFNSQAYIVNFGPWVPVDYDRACPAELELDDGRVWQCAYVIRAGRTKHARAHDFHGDGNP